MQRACDHCGNTYEAKRSTSKFCGSSCRAKSAQGQVPTRVNDDPAPDSPVSALVAQVREELAAVGRLDTTLGQQAVALASAMQPGTPGMAGVSKELREVMEQAKAGVAVANDPIDELRRKRDQRRAAAS